MTDAVAMLENRIFFCRSIFPDDVRTGPNRVGLWIGQSLLQWTVLKMLPSRSGRPPRARDWVRIYPRLAVSCSVFGCIVYCVTLVYYSQTF